MPDLKQLLFFRTFAEEDALYAMRKTPQVDEKDILLQEARYQSALQIIEEAELTQAYKQWVNEQS